MLDNFFSNQIYGFALSGGTSRMLYRLKQIDCGYLVYPNNINHYLEMLLHDQPAFVLGLGTYSGIDQEEIRIETVRTNKFRKDYVDDMEKQNIKLNSFLSANSQMKLAEAMGNSHCNLVSWKIMKLINRGELNSEYTFLHIPKNMKPWIAAQIIDAELEEFKQALKM